MLTTNSNPGSISWESRSATPNRDSSIVANITPWKIAEVTFASPHCPRWPMLRSHELFETCWNIVLWPIGIKEQSFAISRESTWTHFGKAGSTVIVFIYKLFPPFSTTFQLEFIKGQITNLIIVIINYVNTLAAPRLRHFMMIILIMTMIAMTVNYVKSS